jgi:alpha-glucosidase
MNPIDDQKIKFGKNARFTIVSSNLIRAEYSEHGIFLDSPTLAVSERITLPTEYEVRKKGETLEIITKELQLTYRASSTGFDESSLQIQYKVNTGSGTWKFGDVDTAVLPGTLRTLDKMDGRTKVEFKQIDGKRTEVRTTPEFIPGYISPSGYSCYDDSSNIPLSASNQDGDPWVAERTQGKQQDIYFACYGKDYYRALKTMALILGKQPIPPRYALGLWFSRFWEFTDVDLEQIVEDHDRLNIPLDVLVIDMDWHKLGWTGYSWDPTFFPNPSDTLAYLQNRGVKITMNLHPADGVAKHEDQYSAMCEEMDVDPSSGETIPFDCTDPKFMDAYFKLLHHPFEDQGVRFWWMDWQQGQECQLPGLDPLPWLNELHWRDLEKRFPERRPMIFSRFGGAGAGRFPIGFSGDTIISWDSLALQPYFTATAANIGYGYWSHDIGGHFEGEYTDPELYTRWVQFGAYSPIMRLHHVKNPEDHRFLWNYKRPYQDALIAAARKRYKMLPYIASELNHCWQQDTSLCMPMHFEYPDDDAAYQATDQYFFGRQMIVAPITAAADEVTELATQKIWVPEGNWIEATSDLRLTGPQWVELSYTLDQVPTLVKDGAIWVEQSPKQRTGNGSFEDIEINVVGQADGAYHWREDDGDSLGYQNKAYAELTIEQKRAENVSQITLYPSHSNTFEGYQSSRPVTLRLPFRAVPKSIKLNGHAITYKRRGGPNTWTFNGNRLEIIIDLGEINLMQRSVVEVTTSPDHAAVDTKHFVLYQNSILHAWRLAQAGGIGVNLSPYQRSIPWLAQTGRRLTHFPENFTAEIQDFFVKWATVADEHETFCNLLVEKSKNPEMNAVKLHRRAVAILRAANPPMLKP